MSDKLDGEWLEALEVEDAPVEDASVDEEVDNEEVKDEEVKDDSDDGNAEDDKEADEPAKEDEPAEEPEGDNADDKDEPSEAEPSEKAEEKPDVKQAIKEALQEIEDTKSSRNSVIDAFKKEVEETLYPEGINRQLRDSDGDPITGIDDLTKLINPRTGDLFTDEEAGAWLLSAQQKLNKDIEEVEGFIERVAEVNANVKDGADRVAEKYGEILTKDPELKDRLIKAYDRTLVKDPKTGVTINNPIDVEDFFDMALEPRLAVQSATNAEAEAKAKEEAIKAAKAGQSDRGDLKPSGKSDNIDPEDKEWAEAIKEYEEGA